MNKNNYEIFQENYDNQMPPDDYYEEAEDDEEEEYDEYYEPEESYADVHGTFLAHLYGDYIKD